jgi:DNA polymerase V
MIGAGIFDGDLLIIDRSIEVKNNAIVLAILDTEFTVKRFIKTGDSITLRAENDAYDDIQVRGNQTMMVWGVVAHVIHHLK